ncbi:PREDICTED: salicylic acid-binding protein 2-like [Fragaria vesca subsp. vesca]|uniref:salicylic acid-binding protein 2-like n=1 Tax=Fragaria vesca subsp. vesca TaxID=101020 RepID=UPI0002C31502|nr:PREDICTED: salicylic acid-binding protein 2-like [Fragaria vesca subsp. vesca]
MERIRPVNEVVYFLIFLSLVATCSTISATQSCITESSKICAASSSSCQIPVGKKHFVLIHGAGHGAWSWYKVAALLKSSGHNVTALDLGASGINPIQVQQLPSFSDFVEPLTKIMVSLPPKERVILVSHSMAGATIAVFMEKFPEKIAAAVYVSAFMSGPTLNYSTIFTEINKRLDYMDSEFRYDNGTKDSATSFRFGPKVLESFYQLSPPEDLSLGISLVRFSPLYDYDLMKLTEEKYGLVPRIFIVADQDRAIVLDVQNFMIKNNPPDEVRVISGSDHMVMFCRPVELFSPLQNIAEKYS